MKTQKTKNYKTANDVTLPQSVKIVKDEVKKTRWSS